MPPESRRGLRIAAALSPVLDVVSPLTIFARQRAGILPALIFLIQKKLTK